MSLRTPACMHACHLLEPGSVLVLNLHGGSIRSSSHAHVVFVFYPFMGTHLYHSTLCHVGLDGQYAELHARFTVPVYIQVIYKREYKYRSAFLGLIYTAAV
jgi:hypothetical protein